MSAESAAPPAPPRRSRARRWTRRVFIGLGVLLLLLLLVIGAVLFYATTSSGGARIQRLALEEVNSTITGQLTAGRLELRLDKILLYDVVLKDPEGRVVARIEKLEAHVNLEALARRKIDLPLVELTRPEFDLVQDEQGLNLSRALAPRGPSPLPQPDEPESEKQRNFTFEADRFHVIEGKVAYEQRGEERDLRIVAERLGLEASAEVGRGSDVFAGKIDLQGELTSPTRGPLALTAEVQSDERQREGSFSARVAGIELAGELASKNGDRSVVLVLEKLRADPGSVAAWVPGYSLRVPVEGAGTVEYEEPVAQLKLELNAGSARLSVDGAFDSRAMKTPGLVISARSVDLQELLGEYPRSDLSLELRAQGGGTSLDDLEGSVSLVMPPSRLSGERVGPVRIEGTARDGKFLVPQLVAELPGVSLRGAASGSRETVDARLRLEASDLARMARTFGALTAGRLPAVSGRGSLDLSVKGPVRAPGVVAKGAFAQLRYGDYRLQGLALDARVPDVTRPLDSDAHLEVAELRAGDRVFKQVRGDVVTQGRQLTLDLSTRGFAELTVHLAGLIDGDQQGLELRALNVAYPEARWGLEQPAHVRFDEEVISATELSLSGDGQRLVLAGEKRGERVEARVALEDVDLGRLPKALVDPKLGLGGRVDLNVSAAGRLPNPDVTAKLELTGGRYETWTDLSAKLDATYRRDRARGSFSAKASPGEVRATFDTPIEGLMRRRREPVAVTIEVPELSFQSLFRALGQPNKLEGSGAAKLVVSGTAADPRVELTTRANQVRWDNSPPAPLEAPTFALRLASRDDGTLAARLTARSDLLESEAYIALETAYTVAQLWTKPPTPREAMREPIVLTARIRELPMHLLPGAGGKNVVGALSLALDFKGPPVAPVGSANVALRQFAVGGVNPLDGDLELVTEREQVAAKARLNRGPVQLAQLEASVRSPLERLTDPEALFEVPLKVDGTLGPVSVAELAAVRRTPEDPNPKDTHGLFRANLSVDGNLRSPQVHLKAFLEQFATAGRCLGKARMALDYAKQEAVLDVQIASAGGGTLDLDGRSALDLSYPAVQKLELSQVPIDGTLFAKNFDLAFLSGLTPTVRELGGQLHADVRLSGTLAKPDARAKLDWREGVLALAGYGAYQKIRLDLDATLDKISLRELSAESGGGTMRMSADGIRVGKRLDLRAEAVADRFPIIVDDQLVAHTSIGATLEGTASDERVNIRKLVIPEGHVYLPEEEGKELQDLDPPEDVVLVKDGVPVDPKVRKEWAKKRKEELAAKGGGGGNGPKADGPLPLQPETEDLEPEDPPREYWIGIQAPRNLWVHSPDVNAEVGLSEGFRIEKAEATQMFGEVRVLRGRASALGRVFEVERNSSVRFTGPIKQPFINATAVHLNEREGVKVTLTVRGQGTNVKVNATSEPPLSETEIFTLLATGRRTLRPGGTATSGSAQAASIAGSLVASELKETLNNVVPLDVVTVQAGEEGFQGARVEGGTYLSDKAYVGVSYKYGADTVRRRENRVEITFEYQIGPKVSFECSYGDARTGGADLVWTRDW